MRERLWLIWNIKREQWWKSCRHGYTPIQKDAGRYHYNEAVEIVEDANKYCKENEVPSEAMIPCI